MSFLANFVMDSLSTAGLPAHPTYRRILEHSYAAIPPFARDWFGTRYRELARDPEWFANSLVANSALEGYGAVQIWKFSNRLEDERFAAAVRQHSLDESRHSAMFIRMLKLTFPNIEIDAKVETQIDKLQPHYTPRRHPPIEKRPPEERKVGRDAISELIQVHITEIRALILQHLLRPVMLAYAPPSSIRVLTAASDMLIRDEARHIGYTAKFFEEAAAQGDGDFLFDAFEREAASFNELTLEELERDVVEV